MLETRHYAPTYSKLAERIVSLSREKQCAIQRTTEKYDEEIKELRKQCNHKYDDDVTALIRGRYGYNDYRYECQICGREIREKDL